MINWKVRIRNKNFWLAVIPAAALLVQSVAAAFGYGLELDELGGRLMAVVNQLFALLAILGIVNDPTTAGLEDSEQAMLYDRPKEKTEE